MSVTAIRAGRSRTRFVGATARLREPRLGLRHPSLPRGSAGRSLAGAQAASVPVSSRSARGLAALRRHAGYTWARPTPSALRPLAPRTVAPRRG